MNEPDRPRRDVSMEEAQRMPMTDEELAGIEERERAAKEGPWWVDWTQDNDPVVYVRLPAKSLVASVLFEADWAVTADAQFVAHARSDIPALVTEVRRLREERRQHWNRWDPTNASDAT